MQQIKSIPRHLWENCPNCSNIGKIEIPDYQEITHDMAIDAGDPQLEGQLIEWGSTTEQCEFCWTNPNSVFNQQRLCEDNDEYDEDSLPF